MMSKMHSFYYTFLYSLFHPTTNIIMSAPPRPIIGISHCMCSFYLPLYRIYYHYGSRTGLCFYKLCYVPFSRTTVDAFIVLFSAVIHIISLEPDFILYLLSGFVLEGGDGLCINVVRLCLLWNVLRQLPSKRAGKPMLFPGSCYIR